MSGRESPLPKSPIFVDVEASGLGPNSYPIEIGWAVVEWHPDGTCCIRLRSELVRPRQDWLTSPGAWDQDAEYVHGLGRDDLLRDGLDPAALCDLLDREFGGRRVLSDTGGGGTDDMWLALLYEAAGREPAGWAVARETAEEAHAAHLMDLNLSAIAVWPWLRYRAPEPTHAAAEDALVEAWLWAMVDQIGRLGGSDRAQGRALVPPALWPRLAVGSHYRRTRQHSAGDGGD